MDYLDAIRVASGGEPEDVSQQRSSWTDVIAQSAPPPKEEDERGTAQRLGLARPFGKLDETVRGALDKMKPGLGSLLVSGKPSWISTFAAQLLPDYEKAVKEGKTTGEQLTNILKTTPDILTGGQDFLGEAKKAGEGDPWAIANMAGVPLMLGAPIIKPIKYALGKTGEGLKAVDSLISSNPLYKKVGEATGDVTSWLWDKAKPAANYLVDPSISITDRFGAAHKLDDVLGNLPSVTVGALQKMGSATIEGGATFLKKFQPAIDRLGNTEAGIIREGRAQAQLAIREAELLGDASATMALPEKLDVFRGMRGERLGALEVAASNALIDSHKRLAKLRLNPEFVKEMDDNLGTLLTGLLKGPADILTDPHARALLEDVSREAKKSGYWEKFFTTEGMRTRRLLKEVIENPAVEREMTLLARRIYELPALTPELASRAAREASNAWITKRLQALKGADAVTSPFYKDGYVRAVSSSETPGKNEFAWSGLENLWVKKDVALELTSIRDTEKWAKGYINSMLTSPWKTMKIAMSPAAQVRDAFTNIIQNDIAGLPVYRMDIYGQAIKGLRGSATKFLGTALDRHYKDFVRVTGGGGQFAKTELSKLESVWKYDTPWWQVPYKLLDITSEPFKRMRNANDQLFKFAFYLHDLEQGVPKQQAAWNAMKATYNYSEITPAVGMLRSTILPFATWTSKVIPSTIEAAVKHPLRVGKWFGFYKMAQQEAFDKVGITEEEWEKLKIQWPDYMQKGAYLLLPWRDEKGRLNMMDLTYIVPGIGDVIQMTGQGVWSTVFQHPALTIAGDLRSGKKFTGEPITYDWKPVGLQARDYASHIWESLMPSWSGPWGADWKRYAKTMSDEPGAKTVSQTIASQFGAKIQPLDKEKLYRMHAAMRDIHLSEMNTNLNRELRATTSHEKRQKLIRDFVKGRQDFLKDSISPRKSWVDRLVD
jgi:hypothetical protein